MPTLSSREPEQWAVKQHIEKYPKCEWICPHTNLPNLGEEPTLSNVPEEHTDTDVGKRLDELTTRIRYAPYYVDHRAGKTEKEINTEIIEVVEAAKKDIKAVINQQIKSVLDELEKSLIHIDEHICRFNDGEQTCDCYKEADDITRAVIQKIRSRYE